MKNFQILSLIFITSFATSSILKSSHFTRKASVKFSPSQSTVLKNISFTKKQLSNASEHLYKKYMNIPTKERILELFNHPFYTKLIEPIYVGHKTEETSLSLQNYYNLLKVNGHIDFKKDIYLPWKNNLIKASKTFLGPILEQYEQAYEKYIKNPSDKNLLSELNMKSLSIIELMNSTNQNSIESGSTLSDLDLVRSLNHGTNPEKPYRQNEDLQKEIALRNSAALKRKPIITKSTEHEYL